MTTAVRDAAVTLQNQKLPRLFEGGTPFGVFFAVWAIAVVPCGFLIGWHELDLGRGECWSRQLWQRRLLAWLWPVARRQSGRQYQKIQQLLADARQALQVALEAARERGEREAQALVAERDEHLSTAEKKLHDDGR